MKNPSVKPNHGLDEDSLRDKNKVYTNYSLIEIIGDGNCFFRSIIRGLHLETRTVKGPQFETEQAIILRTMSPKTEKRLANNLRSKIVELLETMRGTDLAKKLVDGDFDTHIGNMKKSKTWATQAELYITPYIIRRPINVFKRKKGSSCGLEYMDTFGGEIRDKRAINILHPEDHFDLLEFFEINNVEENS